MTGFVSPRLGASGVRVCELSMRLLCVLVSLLLATAVARADKGERADHFAGHFNFCMLANKSLALLNPYAIIAKCTEYAENAPNDAPTAGAPVAGVTETFQSDNIDATLDPGEPIFGGLMKKTIWGTVKLNKDSRVVINTFGTPFDVALAVYTGATVNKLTRIAANDDYAVPGVYSSPGFAPKQALVAFNAKANIEYHVQIGSPSNSQGDLFANVSYQPPGGSLSATLVALDGTSNAYQGRNYDCGFTGYTSNPCRNPTYLVHNSTSQTIVVTPSTTLGPGIALPVSFTLAPGKAKAVTFAFAETFDKTTPRTLSGYFIFTGRVGSTVVASERAHALIVVGPNGEGDAVLKVSVAGRHVRAASIGEETSFRAVLTNSGSAAAVGCHVRRVGSAPILTNWRRIDPATGDPIGALGAPFTLAAKQSATLDVVVASQTWRVADTRGGGMPVRFDCANTLPAAPTAIANRFDFSALALYRPADLTLTRIAPAITTVDVKKTGQTVIRVSALNATPTQQFRLTVQYERPFDESAPAKQFGISFCQTATDNGACLKPASPNSLEVLGEKGKRLFFKIFVKPPTTNPGFDPLKRAIFVSLRQITVTEGSFEAVVASEGFTPRLVN